VTFAIAYLVAGLLLLGMAVIGPRLQRLPISTAMLYLGAGALLGPTAFGLIEVDVIGDAKLLEHVTEVVVIISLFTAGLKLRVSFRDPRWLLPLRLAVVSMVLTVALVAVVGVVGLGLSWGAAILLGGILAPTDPVLASDVQTAHPNDQDRLRFTLTGEAGLNDGTAFPVVMLGLGLLGLHEIGEAGGGGSRSTWSGRRRPGSASASCSGR
jgi:NhaP-type Na+/H+ or K+/H+ antiporter